MFGIRKAVRNFANSLSIRRRSGSRRQKSAHRKRSASTDGGAPKNPSAAWVASIIELGILGIRREYVEEVKDYVPEGPQSAFQKRENYDKNRYDDVGLLDKTRVVLKNTPDGDDYIHASIVNAGDVVFICSQAPLMNTVEHFWFMVAQEKSTVILQLCPNTENGREKCATYFPESGFDNYGVAKVEVVEVPTKIPMLESVTKTRLKLTCGDVVGQEVVHILYGGWPDRCAADSAADCREVRALVLKFANNKPIVVHCSAGVGRTCTFVAAEVAVQTLKKGQQLNFVNVIKQVRDQRVCAIQNDQQYLFAFRMVLEELLVEGMVPRDATVIDFLTEYDELVKRKKAELLEQK